MDKSPIDSIRVSCTHCSASLKCQPKLIDRAVRCPKCGKQFVVTVPSPTRSKPSPPAPPTMQPPISDARFDRGFTDSPPLIKSAKDRKPVKSVGRTRQQLFVIGILGVFGLLLALVLAGQLIQSAESPSRGSEQPNPFSLIFGCVLLVGMILLYFVPSVVAFVREHQNAIPILVLNLFFGWTLLGWVICLAWSFSSDVRESRQYIKQVIVKSNADD